MTRDFAAELAELRRVYVASLPGKLDEVASAIARRSLEDVRTLAHRLRGTAGSYGMPGFGEAVGAIEDRVDAAAGQDTPALWQHLDGLLMRARSVAGSNET